jgi:hypothetical protein
MHVHPLEFAGLRSAAATASVAVSRVTLRPAPPPAHRGGSPLLGRSDISHGAYAAAPRFVRRGDPHRAVLLRPGGDLRGASAKDPATSSRDPCRLPSRAVNSPRSKLMSLTRSSTHSRSLSPAPYMNDAISHIVPRSCPSSSATSSRDSTTGSRAGCCARTILCIQASLRPKMTSYRNSSALTA